MLTMSNLINLKNLTLFEKLLKLLAGRVGQVMDYSSLAGDVGVDAKTVRSWLSILEASFIAHRLLPHHLNYRKRVVKTPKLYFYDTGLAIRLLGIEPAEQLAPPP